MFHEVSGGFSSITRAFRGVSEAVQESFRNVSGVLKGFQVRYVWLHRGIQRHSRGFRGLSRSVPGAFEGLQGLHGTSGNFREFQRNSEGSGSLSVFHERTKGFNPLGPQGSYMIPAMTTSMRPARLHQQR